MMISFAHAALESLTRSGVSEHHKLREQEQTRGSLAADEGDVEEWTTTSPRHLWPLCPEVGTKDSGPPITCWTECLALGQKIHSSPQTDLIIRWTSEAHGCSNVQSWPACTAITTEMMCCFFLMLCVFLVPSHRLQPAGETYSVGIECKACFPTTIKYIISYWRRSLFRERQLLPLFIINQTTCNHVTRLLCFLHTRPLKTERGLYYFIFY